MSVESGREPTASAAAFRGSEVLLVRHGEAAHHLTGVYGLPGGRPEEIDKTLLDAAAREFEEETGLVPERDSMEQIPTIFEAEIPRKGGEILSTSWHVFAIRRYSGELRGTEEAAPEWVEIDRMSELNLLPNTEAAAREALNIIKNI